MVNETSLPAEVQIAWEAYLAMSGSKTEYFGLLQELDQKYRVGGAPSIAENLHLEKLLKAHDRKVAAFNDAMNNVTDKKARELLLAKLAGVAAGPAGR